MKFDFNTAWEEVCNKFDKMTELEELEVLKQYVIDEGEPSDCLSLEEIEQEILEAKFEEFKKGGR